MNDEFIEPTRHGRAGLILIWLVGVAGMAFLQFWVRPLLMTLQGCDRVLLLERTLASGIGISMALVICGGYSALKALKFKQMPLPGSWVWRRTPVQRGRRVTLKAYVFLAGSVILVLSLAWSWTLMQKAMQEFARVTNCPQYSAVNITL